MPKLTTWRNAFGLTILAVSTAHGVEMTAGDWKFTANGNVNVHYIGSSCEDEPTPAVIGGLACRGSAGEDRTSSVSNGLLPAALAFSASTTQKGYDLAVTFGFYPGISTNDGSPNLGQGAPLRNTMRLSKMARRDWRPEARRYVFRTKQTSNRA